jgi:hypothetical protein
MAYGITNRAKFKDDNGIYYELHILKKDYTGSIRECNVGGDGFKLSWRGRGERIDLPIHSSEITFDFVMQSDSDRDRILNIMAELEGNYIARIYKNDNGTESDFAAITPVGKFWTGVIIMNESIMEDIDYPQIIRLRAIDGLELLKGKKFNEITNIYNERTESIDSTIETVDSDGNFSGGYYSFHSIMLGILNLNPISEVYIENTLLDPLMQFWGGWWSDLTNITEADGYYDCSNIMIVRSNAFYTAPSQAGSQVKYMTCYEALEKILFYLNARIHQEEGIFKIVQLDVYGKWQDNAVANAVSYTKGDNNLTFTLNNKKTLSSQSNKRSDTRFNFGRMTRRLTYNIVGASDANPLNFESIGGGLSIMNQNNFPGNYSQQAWHTFAQSNITIDSTPAESDFKSTFLNVESGQNMTFVFNYSNTFEAVAFTNTAWTVFSAFTFAPRLMLRIKSATDYYLKFDAEQNKYIWDTTQGEVTFYPIPALMLFDTAYPLNLINGTTNSVGSQSLNNMEAVPVDGVLEYYIFYQSRGLGSFTQDSDGNIDFDFSVPLNLGSNIVGQSAPNNIGLYGAPFDFPTASCQLYLNGESPVFVAYDFINEISGTPLENGEEIVDSVNFIEQYATQGDAGNNDIYIKDTSNANNMVYALSPSWTYLYDTTSMAAVHLPSLKAMTILGIEQKYSMIMDTRLVRETDVLGVDPFEFIYLLEETIEGATRYFVCLGGEYIATSAQFTGEWMEVDFDGIDLTNAVFEGTFISDSIQEDTGFNNLELPNNN